MYKIGDRVSVNGKAAVIVDIQKKIEVPQSRQEKSPSRKFRKNDKPYFVQFDHNYNSKWVSSGCVSRIFQRMEDLMDQDDLEGSARFQGVRKLFGRSR